MIPVILLQVAAAMPLLEKGDFRAALAPLTAACESKEPNGCYLLGRAQLSLDRYDQALATFSGSRNADPAPWRVDTAMAQALDALGRASESEALFQQGLRGNRNQSEEPRLHYARFLIRQGRPPDALPILESAVKLWPRSEAVRFELGRAYHQLDRLKDAERELAAAPGIDAAKLLLGKVRRQQKAPR